MAVGRRPAPATSLRISFETRARDRSLHARRARVSWRRGGAFAARDEADPSGYSAWYSAGNRVVISQTSAPSRSSPSAPRASVQPVGGSDRVADRLRDRRPDREAGVDALPA